MSEYRCSQCGTKYTHREYMSLEITSRVTDDPDDEYGVETVCECGARFHSDKWSLRDEITVNDETFDVSTVALMLGHGPNHDDWFETCIFHDYGSTVVCRYKNQDDAEDGHAEVLDELRDGEFRFKSTGKQLVID